MTKTETIILNIFRNISIYQNEAGFVGIRVVSPPRN